MVGAAALIAAVLLPGLARSYAAVKIVPGDGRVVRSLSGTDPITGKRVSLASWAGKPVVINVWGSWCYPCNREAPELARFSRKHPGLVLGIDVEDSRQGAKRFYARYGLRHPSIFDPRSKLVIGLLGGKFAPTTLFLNRRHRIVAAIIGRGTLKQFEEGLRRALT